FSAGSGIGRQLALGATLKAAFSLVWLSLCAIILSFVGSRIMQTVGWTVCLLLAMATALAALDFWDFIHPAPVRRRFLLCACVMAVIYALTDFSIYTIVGTALTWLVASVHAIWKRGQGWKSLGAAVGLVALIGIGGMLFEEVTDRTESWKSSDAVIVRIPSPAPHTKAAYPEGLPAEVSRWWPHPGPARALRAPPVVVMAASGGGSRAAVLTALTLEKLASTPIPSAGANRPAIAAPAESFADHLHAISSVSGGSLATAAFLARRLRGESPEGLSRDVADDFLQPVLLGALDPFTSRGQALEDYWVDKLHLGDRLSSVAARWKEGIREKLPPLPVPLFNSATLDAHAVVLTPLDWAGYKNKLEASAADGQSLYERGDGQAEPPTWVYYRSAIYSLQDLLPGYDPTLASAVRASANFPFGFPVVQLATSRPLCFSPVLLDAREGPKERVRLTDGGVVSNSGLWTLSRLLATHAEELRARGVILVIVDGSRMPEYKGRTRTRDLVSAILDQSLIAANLHSTMLEYLRERLERRLAVAVVALDPKEAYNVYTSWALDESSRKQIEQVTAPTLEALSERVTTAWKALESGAELAELPHRLPLD
ncbi:MAG TPA: patatin-like phospholipase family protein, partial [Polyangiaceae bacterium]|nr:patatin-like phospholipase family protein [Polyangiaceae bacterium]